MVATVLGFCFLNQITKNKSIGDNLMVDVNVEFLCMEMPIAIPIYIVLLLSLIKPTSPNPYTMESLP